MTNLLLVFIFANIVNVIIQTIKSLCTIKCGKGMSALVNALAYGFYTWVVVLMVAELPLLQKCLIVGLCNLVGVYIVKWLEEMARKDKLWEIRLTVRNEQTASLHSDLSRFNIPHNYIENVGKWTIFNCYCATQKESSIVKKFIDKLDAKYFVAESQTLL